MAAFDINLVIKNWKRFCFCEMSPPLMLLCFHHGNLIVESRSKPLSKSGFICQSNFSMYCTTGVLCFYEQQKIGNFHHDLCQGFGLQISNVFHSLMNSPCLWKKACMFKDSLLTVILRAPLSIFVSYENNLQSYVSVFVYLHYSAQP